MREIVVWVVVGGILVGLSFVLDDVIEERDAAQVELERVRAEVGEVWDENQELVKHLCGCADDLWHAYQRWDEHLLHATMSQWMCKCLAPPPYSIDQEMECIALTLEVEKRFEEMEQE
jgi:hypothetical protein